MYKSNLKQNLINEWQLTLPKSSWVESALVVNRIATVEELLLLVSVAANFLRYFGLGNAMLTEAFDALQTC